MMDSLKMIPYIALVLAIAGIIIGASALVIGQFTSTTTDTGALAALANASRAIGVVGGQLSTIAIIAVMVIIIVLLAGAFAYITVFGR